MDVATPPPPPTLLASLCLLILSCGDATRDAAATTDIPLTATTESLYTVGALVGEDWETFGSVRSVQFDDEGNLHIFDAGAHRMVVVDADGNHLRTVGTQGEGPGEIANAQAAAVLDDGQTVIYDFGNPAAFEIFDTEGEFARSVTADVNRGVPGERMHTLADGRLVTMGGPKIRMYAPGEVPDESQEEEEEDHRRDIDIFSLDGSDKMVLYRSWNLPPTESDESIEGSSEEGGGISMSFNRMREFNPGLLIGVLSDGRVAVVDSMAYEVKLVAMDGTVDGTITRPVAPEPVTEAVKEATRTARLEGLGEATDRLQTIAGDVNLNMQEQMRAMIVRQIETMIFTEEIPVIADLAVDREDRLWIARMGPAGDQTAGPTDIIAASGRYIGTLPADGLPIPAAFGPNGLMAYIDSDEMGVQTVRVIRLVSLDG